MPDHAALIAEARAAAGHAREDRLDELLVALADALEATTRPAGYVVGWQDGERVELALDESELSDILVGPDRHAYADLGDALAFLTEITPEDPDITFHVYALHELRGDITRTASPDRPPAETVTAEFETVLAVFFDGFGTGAASALGKIKPDAPGAMIDQAAQALLERVKVDPLAVEQLRDLVRNRLRGNTHNHTTEVRVWPGDDA